MYNFIATVNWHTCCDHVGSRNHITRHPAARDQERNRFLACREFHRLSAALLTYLVLIVAKAQLCPHKDVWCQNSGTKDLVSSWRRVIPKIIVRKRATKIFGEIGNRLKKSTGSTDPNRTKVAKCWSIPDSLLNNHPKKITGSSTAAKIRLSVLRHARNVTGINSSFRGNSWLHSAHS